MKEPSPGAFIAWQIAAGEAGIAKQQHIEQEHLLIGICSFEKVLMTGGRGKLDTQTTQALQIENKAIEDVLRGSDIDTTQLRRRVRSKLEEGNYQHTEKVIHRSEACKNIFNCADELVASPGTLSSIHLLAALLEDPGDIVSNVLQESGVKLPGLQEQVLACARKWETGQLVEDYRAAHIEKQDDAFHLPANLSQEANQIFALARQESERLMHFYLGTEHIFIALSKIENGLTQAVLRQVTLDPEQFRANIRKMLVRGDGNRYWEGLLVTPRCQTVLKLADEEALRRNFQIEENDLLLGILKEGDGIPVRVVQTLNDSSQTMIKLIEECEVKAGEKKYLMKSC